MGLSVDSGCTAGWTTGLSPQVPCLRTLLGTHLVGRGAPWKLGREISRGVAPTVSPFFETSEVKNESAEALLMSQSSNAVRLDTKNSTEKVHFLLEMFHQPLFSNFHERIDFPGKIELGLWDVSITSATS